MAPKKPRSERMMLRVSISPTNALFPILQQFDTERQRRDVLLSMALVCVALRAGEPASAVSAIEVHRPGEQVGVALDPPPAAAMASPAPIQHYLIGELDISADLLVEHEFA
jgi:hypothetical protein